MFAVIFASAGTIGFWQEWLFCLSFWFSTIAIGIYLTKRDPPLLERRMRFGPAARVAPDSEDPRNAHFRVVRRACRGACTGSSIRMVTRTGCDRSHRKYIDNCDFWSVPPGARENTFASSTIAVEAGQRVTSTGPYALVRHPLYPGALLLILAMPVALGSLWGLFLSVIAILLLITRILDEERALSVGPFGLRRLSPRRPPSIDSTRLVDRRKGWLRKLQADGHRDRPNPTRI
jgi:hypothetical protein